MAVSFDQVASLFLSKETKESARDAYARLLTKKQKSRRKDDLFDISFGKRVVEDKRVVDISLVKRDDLFDISFVKRVVEEMISFVKRVVEEIVFSTTLLLLFGQKRCQRDRLF